MDKSTITTTGTVNQLVRSHGGSIAFFTVVMSFFGIQALSDRGYVAVGWIVTTMLAVLCVGVVYDRYRLLRGIE